MLEEWTDHSASNRHLLKEMKDEETFSNELKYLNRDFLESKKDILFKDIQTGKLPVNTKAHRVHFLRTAWFRYAAAIVLIIGVVAYLYTTKEKQSYLSNNNKINMQDVSAPASIHATITLGDGKQIILDNATSGALASQGNVILKKLADGQIVYLGNSKDVVYNTLTNPRGSKSVVMTLSDGTKVWLNSESSITYPTAFTNMNREVKITGEAYFEVSHDPSRPFKVKNNKAEVTVLGTSFNINTYEDEPDIKVTLLEGSVKVSNGNNARTIKPGQQAQIKEGIAISENVNLEEIMAWKNSKFQFTNASIETIMKQVARWYNAEVVYEGKITGNFVAGISREVPVSKLLDILELTNRVKFKIEGKKIIVKP